MGHLRGVPELPEPARRTIEYDLDSVPLFLERIAQFKVMGDEAVGEFSDFASVDQNPA